MPIQQPQDNKRSCFYSSQAAARNNVETKFRILHAQFSILRGLAQLWDKKTLGSNMMICVILHNMITDGEWRGEYLNRCYDIIGRVVNPRRREDHIKSSFKFTMRSEMRRHVNNLKMISLRSGGMWSGQTNT
jgi:hypothetical protein